MAIVDCRVDSKVKWNTPAAFAWSLMAIPTSELALFIMIDFEVKACFAELIRRAALEEE